MVTAKSLGGTPPVKSLHNTLQGQTTASFTDQSGCTAISAYYGKRPRAGAAILPPNWSFQVYVTYGAIAQPALDLPERLLTAIKAPVLDSYPLRLDVRFAPSASVETCVEHYRADKAARLEAGAPLQVLDHYQESYTKLSVFVQIEHEDWKAKGAAVVSFDMTSGLDDEGDSPQTSIQRDVQWGDLRRASGNPVFEPAA
ncbi:hypothetical protein LTS14_003787 [Recurvomyces mirabilis]|uniref:uncharacterized protein n=1 Tax=Recurvomyces mirabilis TaxID=574656 RepID=UPI002DE07A72|nr:hypothetical protein LTS14_003787 [Recurvomyces mirabilis]